MPKTLDLVPKDKGAVLLLRHSLRNEIPDGTHGLDIPLTPEGVLLAEQWGKDLSWTIGGIKSSPIGRCVQTGNAIISGKGLDCEVVGLC